MNESIDRRFVDSDSLVSFSIFKEQMQKNEACPRGIFCVVMRPLAANHIYI
jgi:hypothetical protein